MKLQQVGIIVFNGGSQTCPKYQNKKLVMLFQYIKIKVSQLFWYSVEMQHNQILYGDPVSVSITCFWVVFFNFFNWDSLHTRLNIHCKAWSYKKNNHKKIKSYRKSISKEPTVNRYLLNLDLKPFRS